MEISVDFSISFWKYYNGTLKIKYFSFKKLYLVSLKSYILKMKKPPNL